MMMATIAMQDDQNLYDDIETLDNNMNEFGGLDNSGGCLDYKLRFKYFISFFFLFLNFPFFVFTDFFFSLFLNFVLKLKDEDENWNG